MNSSLILHPPMLHLPTEYNFWLVVLSILIAIVAAYVALDLSGRVFTTTGRERTYWLLGGACAMGTGIWSMHFIGMLAFNLPIVVRYDIGTVFLSWLAAVLASGMALMVVSHANITLGILMGGSLAMGAGITTMHYTGMAAMRLTAMIEYDEWLVALSVLIAVSVSGVGLRIVFFLRDRTGEIPTRKKISGAIFIGSAIPSMHYTAMAAASYVPLRTDSLAMQPLDGLDISILGGLAITAGTVLVLWATSVAAFVNRQQEALRTSEQRTRAIINSALDAVVAINHKGVIIDWNIRATAIFGWSREEVLGRELASTIVPERYREAHRTGLARFLKTGEGTVLNRRIEITALRKDGTEIPVELAIAPIKLGDHYEFSAFIEDISERKRVEQDLIEAKEAAESANVAKSQFLANMSHEIRTPMNGVIGMTEILLQSNLPPDQQRMLETIRFSGDHLLTVINDILDISKIEAGKFELLRIDFDLRTTVESVLEQLQPRAHGKGLNLCSLFYADVPTALRGDAGRIRQILTNLVGNAIKFTQHGEIVVRIALNSPPSADTVHVRLSVSDTGIGISPEGQARLFQSFSQVDASSTRQYGGTGLGLAICKQLVQLMGGEIGVDSRPGHGTMFWVTLPLARRAEPPVSRPSTCHDLSGLRICVVDDHPTNREILEHYLQSWKVEPVSAASGREALDLLDALAQRGETCAAAILDFHMPEMDGLALARAIKADPRLSAIRLLLLTSVAQRGDAEAALNAGFGAYLTKPTRYRDLHDALVRLIFSSSPVEPNTVPPLVTRHTLTEAKPSERRRILVVEDNPVNQEVAAMMLDFMGHSVDVAWNGREAVEAVLRTSYDLMFMDCQMPEMDGFEATRRIREWERSETTQRAALRSSAPRRIPIIALTANAFTEDRENCLAVGMDDFLPKPFTEAELKAVLTRWLPSKPTTNGDGQIPADTDSASSGKAASWGPEEAIIPSSAGVAEIDRAAWQGISALQRPGQPDVLAKVLSLFLEEARTMIDRIKVALAQQDIATITRLAHSLKSQSATVGATRLAALCKEIEGCGRRGDLRPAVDLVRQLSVEGPLVHTVLDAEVQQRGERP